MGGFPGYLPMHVSRRVIRQGGLAGLTAVTLVLFILATMRYIPTTPASWSDAVDAGLSSFTGKVGNDAVVSPTAKSTTPAATPAAAPIPTAFADTEQIYSQTQSSDSSTSAPLTASTSPKPQKSAFPSIQNASLADVLGHMLVQNPPSDMPSGWVENRFDSEKWQWDQPEVELLDKIALNGTEIVKMRNAHRGFVRDIEQHLPEYVQQRFIGQPSFPENRGIVTIGGGKYFAILIVSLRFLRRSGTNLPVEVFVPAKEYEVDMCENVLPAFNAVCRILPELGGGAEPLKGFQFKAFAMVFSTFDQLIFLDADCTAMRDLAPLFQKEPFTSTGLVTWPDLWLTSVSPLYYVIAEQEVVPIAAHASSETGQVVISKTLHWRTLLLIAYYNYYGPTYYYRLLGQGGTGMGDKDTFLPAANVFGLPYYHVRKPVIQVGHRFEDGSTGSRVQVQYDAIEDYDAAMKLGGLDKINEDPEARTAAFHPVRPLFLHLSWPKWDASNLLEHISKWSDMTKGVNGKPEAAFHWPEELALEIYGTERMLWEEATWSICNLHDRIKHWAGMARAARMCDRLHSHFEKVLDSSVGKELGLAAEDVLYPQLPEIKLRPKPEPEAKDGH